MKNRTYKSRFQLYLPPSAGMAHTTR